MMDWWKSFCVVPERDRKERVVVSSVECETELKRVLQSGEQGLFENFKDEVTSRTSKTSNKSLMVYDYGDLTKISAAQNIPELLESLIPSNRTEVRCKDEAVYWAQGWVKYFFKKYRVLIALEQLPAHLHITIFNKLDEVERCCGKSTTGVWVDLTVPTLPNRDVSKRTRALTFVMTKYRKSKTRLPKRDVYEHYVKTVRCPVLSEVEFESLIKKTKILSTSKVYDVYYASLVS